jgi:preprotein translocase subunit SecG
MSNLLLILNLLVALALLAMILVQAKGTGLSAVFGGEGGMYRSRRGVEKLLHRATIVAAAAFMTLAVVNIIVNK